MNVTAWLQRPYQRPVEPRVGKEGAENTGTQKALGAGSEKGPAQGVGQVLLPGQGQGLCLCESVTHFWEPTLSPPLRFPRGLPITVPHPCLNPTRALPSGFSDWNSRESFFPFGGKVE